MFKKPIRVLLTASNRILIIAAMNWKSIINEILAAGKTQVAVADRLGRSQAWVSAVSQGKYADIGWCDGQALLALHAELFGAHKLAANSPDGTEVNPVFANGENTPFPKEAA